MMRKNGNPSKRTWSVWKKLIQEKQQEPSGQSQVCRLVGNTLTLADLDMAIAIDVTPSIICFKPRYDNNASDDLRCRNEVSRFV